MYIYFVCTKIGALLSRTETPGSGTPEVSVRIDYLSMSSWEKEKREEHVSEESFLHRC